MPRDNRDKRDYRCSFCGKSQDQVRRMIAGPNYVYICNECVALCNEIIAEESPPDTTPKRGDEGHTTTNGSGTP